VRGLFVLRLVVTVLAVALAIAFFARGDLVVGGLLLAFVITRVVMMAVMSRRRQEARAAVRERRSPEG
jgi:hypothetical protein